MGYDKYDQTTKKDNYRNGSSEKTIKTLQGHIISYEIEMHLLIL